MTLATISHRKQQKKGENAALYYAEVGSLSDTLLSSRSLQFRSYLALLDCCRRSARNLTNAKQLVARTPWPRAKLCNYTFPIPLIKAAAAAEMV